MRIGINAQLLSFGESYRQAGLSRYIYEIVLRVPALRPGDRFTAFVSDAPVPASFLEAAPSNLSLSASRLPTGSATARIAWEQAVLPAAAARARLDLLHCPVNVRPILCPCPAVVTVHDVIFLRYPQAFRPSRRRYLAAMTGFSSRHAACVITVSEATRRDVIKFFRVPPSKVATIHNGVGEQFRPLPAQRVADFKRGKGLADCRVLLYIGTLEPRKNIPLLIRAFGQLVDSPQFSDCVLLIGGSKGWYYDDIYATAEKLGLVHNGRVRFLGRLPDDELPLWYNTAAAFAYPSLYEGFGLPVLEAMACGTPALAANTSAFPEVVGEAGILLDPSDEKAWHDALASVLTDDGQRQRLSALGLAQATRFSWQRAAEETARIYDRVLAKNGS